MRLEGFQGMQRILPSRRYCICEGIEEIRSNEFEAFPKFVLWWLVERDCENGFVFLWREELKFKLRYVRIMNTCWNKVWVFFFLERGSWNFWKNHVRMIAGTKVKMVVYFRGDFGEKFFAKVIYKLRHVGSIWRNTFDRTINSNNNLKFPWNNRGATTREP